MIQTTLFKEIQRRAQKAADLDMTVCICKGVGWMGTCGGCHDARISLGDVLRPEMVLALLNCVEALKFYAEGKHLMGESLAGEGNVCPPIGSHAKTALNKLKEAGVTL